MLEDGDTIFQLGVIRHELDRFYDIYKKSQGTIQFADFLFRLMIF